MVPGRHFESDSELRGCKALLEMADIIVRHRDLGELLRNLAPRVRDVVSFELLWISLHDAPTNSMRVHVSEGVGLSTATPLEPVSETPGGWVWQHQQSLIISDLSAETRFPHAVKILERAGIRSGCIVPLTAAQNRLGALALGSLEPNGYEENDLPFLQRMADVVALAVDSALTRGAFEREKDRLQVLLDLNTALASSLDLSQLFPIVSGHLRKVVKQDLATVALFDESTRSLKVYALDPSATNGGLYPGLVLPVDGSAPGRAFREKEALVLGREEVAQFHAKLTQQLAPEPGFQSACCIPLISRNGPVGTLNLASREENAFVPQDMTLLKQVAAQIAIALDNARAYSEIAELKNKLAGERLYLQDEIRSELNFEEIVGESAPLKHALDQAKTVAPSGATVLILGETGTGKELIARAIHRMSTRSKASFIKLNCAAIPTGLLESELFGHEKGAFTGAISQKIGRLELADKGTLFLDEVGDIPLELQPKLLRVLQDQEFERLGSIRTQRVDIRLIAATNRDLGEAIKHRQFRSDLFYRLNVFPIRIPPLRERKPDIPLLVRYFVQLYARRMNKTIDSIPAEAAAVLNNWHWPGNVRELENLMERSVILSESGILRVPLSELRVLENDRTGAVGALENVEREHIIRILRETGGVISGLSGAAARLGMKRTTLQSRIQKLGISRADYEN